MVIGFFSLAGHRKGNSRFLTRSTGFTAILAIGICSIVYLTWFLPGFSVKTGLERFVPIGSAKTEIGTEEEVHWDESPRRLIVFGDSWSDNGQYPIDPPPKDLMPVRDEARGKVWTEWLCAAISCTHHDNFARSLPQPWDSGFSGAVVDSNLLNSTLMNTTLSNSSFVTVFEIAEPLADLKTQVQHWLQFEKHQYTNSRVSQVERNGTVFTIWFSLWDLWYYSEKTITEAEVAVTKTMDTLFEQLDLIAENWPVEMKIIMPEAIDTTFLPAWTKMRTGPRGSDPQGENQRSAVRLVEQWNQALDMRATRWDHGSMYIYNTNEWLLEQVREQQLYTAHLTDANGMGSTEPPWSNVRSGCVETNATLAEASGIERCSDPSTYLFWDDMHLGPEAMKMIGEGIAQDIASNRGDSWFAHEITTTKEAPSSAESNPEPSAAASPAEANATIKLS